MPTNQAFGLLLLWQRLKEHLREDRGALVAFVFGDGTRSTPFAETDNAQKPAIATFVREEPVKHARFLSMVEVAMRCFVPVQPYLRRSGFNGLVVKWGDKVQIPTRDLSGPDPLLREADVVRFVSVREIDADGTRNKDWGVDAQGHVTAFIPRRPLAEMDELASRGLVQRRGNALFGGVNLGSIAIAGAFLDCLLDEFKSKVNDATAKRQDRPALDPEFFTALTIAVLEEATARNEAWDRAQAESPEVAALQRRFPDVLVRLGRALESFQARHGRRVKMVAMDFGDQYWGDIGQHAKIYEFYAALNRDDATGDIARAPAELPEARDNHGNLLVHAEVGPGIQVRNSVLVSVTLSGSGLVENSVRIGTRAKHIRAESAFDVLSTALELTLSPRSGTYKVVSATPVKAGPGERLTTLFLPTLGPHLFRVNENTDMKNKTGIYSVPIAGNPISFRQAHQEMGSVSAEALEQARTAEEQKVLGAMGSARCSGLGPLPQRHGLDPNHAESTPDKLDASSVQSGWSHLAWSK